MEPDLLHLSVLRDALVDLVEPAPGELWVDGTAGAGGHSAALLEAGIARLIAVDRDLDALDIARERLAPFASQVELVHGRFAELDDILDARGIDAVDGIVLDLGVSSMHLDRGERGFSFSRPGPIDMRMDRTRGETALELIRTAAVDELAELIRTYGEERYARRIAERLRDAARSGALETTADLAAVIDAAIPAKSKRHQRIHPATRTFQALRIAVNAELDQLTRFLDAFADLLNPGGRCVIISFHSLEDRLVKEAFREDDRLEVVTRRPIRPTELETLNNPRARSAKFRVAARK